MKNVDVPMWDKGDATDSYSKGGGSSFDEFMSSSNKTPIVENVYDLVLGRKPTSREIAVYRYANSSEEDMIKRLLNSQEHKQIIEKGRDYPLVEKREELAKSNLIKLKHRIEDISQEHTELLDLLNQKNRAIEGLRENKEVPYINGSVPENKYNVFYNSNENITSQKLFNKESLLDKLYNFLKSISS